MLTTLFTLLAGTHAVEIPFEYVHGHLILEAKVNGKPQRLAFDSAVSGQLHIDSGLSKELSLPKLGQTQSSDGTSANAKMVDLVQVEAIQIGSIEIRNVQAVARDLKAELGGHDAFDGVLGANIFRGYLVTIDYAGRKIRLSKGTLPEPDGKSILPLTEADGIYRVPLKLAGRQMEANLDTGSPLGMIMPLKDSGTIPLVEAPKIVGQAKTLHNTIDVYQAQVNGEIEIGAFALERGITFFNVFETPNLGNGVLSKFEVVLDLASKRIQLRKP